eukprot:1625341-Amphidinium_carterae.1
MREPRLPLLKPHRGRRRQHWCLPQKHRPVSAGKSRGSQTARHTHTHTRTRIEAEGLGEGVCDFCERVMQSSLKATQTAKSW